MILGQRLARVARQLPLASSSARSVHVEAKLDKMGITLPPASPPKGSFVLASRTGNLIYTAGHLPADTGGNLVKGKVGKEVSEEEANAAARLVAINLMGTLKNELGDLDRVKRVVKLVGFVNCVDGFSAQPAVVNGASDLLLEVFGEKGRHSRSAVGTNALPLNVAVEIEAIVEVEG